MTPDLERVLRADYVADINDRPIEDIRTMRLECQGLENGLSYIRRLAQGRMDIVGSELQRRRNGGSKEDLAALIDRLPGILAEHSRGPGQSRPPLDMDPDSRTTQAYEAALAGIGRNDRTIGEVGDDQLAGTLEQLVEFEAEVSSKRRHLHEIIDVLRDELTRRYRTGEATVDSLLR